MKRVNSPARIFRKILAVKQEQAGFAAASELFQALIAAAEAQPPCTSLFSGVYPKRTRRPGALRTALPAVRNTGRAMRKIFPDPLTRNAHV
jgi:hypothetical protein